MSLTVRLLELAVQRGSISVAEAQAALPDVNPAHINPALVQARVRGFATHEGPRMAYRYRITAAGLQLLAKAKKARRETVRPFPPPPVQGSTWAKAPVGRIKRNVPDPPGVPATVGLALGYDCRVQMGPEEAAGFVGEFGRLGVGRYLE